MHPRGLRLRDHHADLLVAGASAVHGISSQTTEHQREVVERLHLPFTMLADPDLLLSDALGLPTSTADGQRLYRRLTVRWTDIPTVGILLQMPRDMTEPASWVLTALAEAPRHGYAVLRRVEELSGGSSPLRVTTLYATLERLEREGRVRVVSEEVVDGRARRTYDVTADGREALSRETDRLVVRARAARASLGQARPVLTPTAGWVSA